MEMRGWWLRDCRGAVQSQRINQLNLVRGKQMPNARRHQPSDNSNSKTQLTDNENLRNVQPGWGIVPWLPGSQLPVAGEAFRRQLTDVLSATPSSLWTLGWLHISIFMWSSMGVVVSLISCLSAMRFNFKSWTHFHEWLSRARSCSRIQNRDLPAGTANNVIS